MPELFLLGLAAAVAWKVYQLARAPHDAPLRSVTLCLLTAALSYPLAMPGGASGVDTVAGHGAAKLLQNVLLLLTVYFLMCFYLYSAEGQAGRRRARWEAVVVVLVAVSITVAAISVPHKVFAGSFSTADMEIPQIAFFYGGAGLYLMYALAVAARWTRLYARMSRRPHSTGLWMATLGLSAMAVACAVRAVIVAIRWGGRTVPGPLMAGVAFLLVASILLFVAGVTYPGVRARIASLRLWLRHRRDHRRLEPLWELLSEAYPENVLKPASPALRDRRRARGVHRRYHRRIVECRDGLVDISPYLAGDADERAPLDLDPAELAGRLRQAIARIGEGNPAPRQAMAVAMSLGGDRDADVRQLIAVSDALAVAHDH
ncbi:MAB_1171c family putative transporter [Streptomyces sp. NPDC094438]|uniref:MAB_1171c family putative transporter n=1 Tax=Streptomyces sp. NPDC094438 TaxID=3366061 RepID=UPI0038210232